MKANATIKAEIDTANYPGYEDSAQGVQNVAQDILLGLVKLVEKPEIVVDAELPPPSPT